MSDTKEDHGDDEKIYGGCEGPDAMFVKLVSSDGHEFIVKRDHALTSGTIKAMLSGPGKNPSSFRWVVYFSNGIFTLYGTETGGGGYKERNWHNRKQWALVPVSALWLMAYSHCTGIGPGWYREWDWHNKKTRMHSSRMSGNPFFYGTSLSCPLDGTPLSRHQPPPHHVTEWITYRCKNITLPQSLGQGRRWEGCVSPSRTLGQGNVFTPVSDLFCSQVGREVVGSAIPVACSVNIA